MNRLQELLADDQGPDYVHAARRRGENIWPRGSPPLDQDNPPNMLDFPSDEDMIRAWNEGLEMAQQELRQVGVHPETDNQNEHRKQWFYAPHRITGATDAQIFAEMRNDDDNDDDNPPAPNPDGDVREFQLNVEEDGYVDNQDVPFQQVDLELHDHINQVAEIIEDDELPDETTTQTSATMH